ncbi:MAG: 50S ribosomal protein L17 [Actinobacteria bacterium]|nr:50S ribosomal protein L17 [Actinomycetota bacterium]
MPATPRRARNFGGSAHHQKLLMANLAASLFAAEGIVTTEGKAKALRPIAEKLITKAIKAQDAGPMRIHRIRQIYASRNGGYTRILKLGPRHGDNAPMARIELV